MKLLKKSFFFFQVFSNDSDSNVQQVEMDFLHYKFDGWWDFPKQHEQKIVETKYIFYGPTKPKPPTKLGYKFEDDDEKAFKIYKELKGK